MPDRFPDLFLDRLEQQCKRARVAFDRLNRLVRASPARDTPELYECVDSLVSQAGKISRFLFPGRPQKCTGKEHVKDRAARLRHALAVQEDSILKSRTVRDHLDHFDERLHGRDPTTELVVMGNIGPAGAISVANPVWLDHFDPATLTVSYGSDRLDLRKLMDEINRLERNKAAASTSLRPPPP